VSHHIQLKAVDFRAVFYAYTKVLRCASNLMFRVKVILQNGPLQEEMFDNSSETDYWLSFVEFCFVGLRASVCGIAFVWR
jgi:hypothetical protein